MELGDILNGLGQVSGAVNSFNGQQSSAGGITLPSSVTAGANGLGGLVNAAGSFASGNLVGGVAQLFTSFTSLFGGGPGVPDHERPDLIKISQDNDVTQDEASWVCGFEESKVRDNYDTIVARAANDRGYFQNLLAKWNAAKPGQQIKSQSVLKGEQYSKLQAQTATMFGNAGLPSPLANLSLSAAQSAAQQQSMTLGDYLKVLLDGALAGLTKGTAEAAADTPAGQQIKWDTIKSYAKEYELPLVGFGLLVAWMGYHTYENLTD